MMEPIIAKLLTEFERGRMSRRQLVQSLALVGAAAASRAGAAAAAAEGGALRASGVNHLSYSVPDYKKTRDFYSGLFGMQVRGDDGAQCTLAFGDAFIVVRKGEQGPTAYVDHFAISIEDWNKESVEALLKGRGLQPTPDGERSFHVKDPDGFDLQISGARQKR